MKIQFNFRLRLTKTERVFLVVGNKCQIEQRSSTRSLKMCLDSEIFVKIGGAIVQLLMRRSRVFLFLSDVFRSCSQTMDVCEVCEEL